MGSDQADDARKYAQQHKLQSLFETLAAKVLQERPEDPLKMIAELLAKERDKITESSDAPAQRHSSLNQEVSKDAGLANAAAVSVATHPSNPSEGPESPVHVLMKKKLQSMAAMHGSISDTSEQSTRSVLKFKSDVDGQNPSPAVVFVVGASMSGKTTVCEQLLEHMTGVAVVSVIELRQALSAEIGVKGVLRCNLANCVRAAVDERAIAQVVIFDGAPESLEDVLILEDHELRPLAVVSLEAPAEVLSERRDERIHRTASANTLAGDNPAAHLGDAAFQQRVVAEYYRARGIPCVFIDAFANGPDDVSLKVIQGIQEVVGSRTPPEGHRHRLIESSDIPDPPSCFESFR